MLQRQQRLRLARRANGEADPALLDDPAEDEVEEGRSTSPTTISAALVGGAPEVVAATQGETPATPAKPTSLPFGLSIDTSADFAISGGGYGGVPSPQAPPPPPNPPPAATLMAAYNGASTNGPSPTQASGGFGGNSAPMGHSAATYTAASAAAAQGLTIQAPTGAHALHSPPVHSPPEAPPALQRPHSLDDSLLSPHTP